MSPSVRFRVGLLRSFVRSLRLVFAMLLVGNLVHEIVDLAGVGHLDLHEPRVLLRRRVDQLGCVLERLVDLEYRPRDRGVHVRGGLDGLDASEGIPRVELVADGRQIHEDDVPEGALGVIGDAAGSDVPLNLDVFVG